MHHPSAEVSTSDNGYVKRSKESNANGLCANILVVHDKRTNRVDRIARYMHNILVWPTKREAAGYS